MSFQDQIEAARDEIARRCDGPVDDFVLMSRAADLAARPGSNPSAIAKALHEELADRGFLTNGYVEVPGS